MTDTKPTYDLKNHWMPFTSNRDFRERPRILVSAQGMYYHTDDGRKVLDGKAGLWCCHCGHGRQEIVDAIAAQAKELDFAPTFQYAHPKVFELATRLANEVFPGNLNSIFFTNSGSEAVDSALKIALAYHRHRGQGGRTKLIGRERAYHGVNFGGISVGGMPNNKKWFGNQLDTAHIRHTHDLQRNSFTRGQPEHGAELADDLERLIALHDASTIAAVIIEPMAGSTGVLIPPKGYLNRIREICDKHDILLIFDEVISGFGRLGAATASERFGVTPDMITFAKGVNSGTVPLGGVALREDIPQAFIDNTKGSTVDFFHGYTYSGHPLACAAGLAAQDIYKKEGLFARAQEIEEDFADALHSLKGFPNVIDIRNYGLVGAVELEPREGSPGARAYEAAIDAFHNEDVMLRFTGDIIAVSPPLVVSVEQIGQIVERLGNAIKRVA